MKRSSFLHNLQALLAQGFRRVKALALNLYFWAGLAVLGAVGLGAYVIVNNFIMPSYTRHDVAVRVPFVLNETYEDAERMLAEHGLRVGRVERRFNPKLPRDVIVDQDPAAHKSVKPGRRIYLTVNTGEVSMVKVPRVEELSLREAINRVQAVGLTVSDTRPDSIPSPHRNTVTRQKPRPGESLPEGSSVTLWYSTGPGDRYVTIPDVRKMSVSEAQQTLLRSRLRAVVVDQEHYRGLTEPVVLRQGREPGTRVREGFEVRLYIVED